MANNQSALAPDPIDLSGLFHALADPTRRAVVRALCAAPASVSALATPFDMTLPTFLKHIQVLERCGLVRTTKVGRTRTCALDVAKLSMAERWIADQRALWESRLDRLDALLADIEDADDHEKEDPS